MCLGRVLELDRNCIVFFFFFIGELWERHLLESMPLQILWKSLVLDMMILSVFQLEVVDSLSIALVPRIRLIT